MKRLLLPLITVLALTTLPAAHAADDCVDGCIDVYTQNGQLIIEGRKGSGPISKKYIAPQTPPKKKVVSSPPVKKKAVAPKPRSTFKPPVTLQPAKKVVKRKAVKRVAPPTPRATAQSLADRLIKLLPAPGLRYQPGYEPLVHMPIYFATGLPQTFNTVVDVIGEEVNVQLVPHFHYDFGDGQSLDTTDVGGFYPHQGVTHTYTEPGEYNVRVDIVWGGVFITKGISKAVRGAIELVINAPITVVATTNRFMN